MPFTPRQLLDLNDDAFWVQLRAAAKVRHSHPEEWEPFTAAEPSLRAIGAIAAAIDQANARADARKVDPEAFGLDDEALAEFRRKTALFISHVRPILEELKEASGLTNWGSLARTLGRVETLRHQLDIGRRYHDRMLRLAAAIRRHRFESAVADIDPEPHDLALWAFLAEPAPYGDDETGDEKTLGEVLDTVEMAMARRAAAGRPEPEEGREWRELLAAG